MPEKNTVSSPMKQSTRNILEFAPLLIFFVIYKWQDLIIATAALVAATTVTVIISYVLEKKVPMMPLVSAIILGIFGTLTVVFEDEFFIKIKPTIVNILFSVVLIGGALLKKSVLKHLLGHAITMPEKAWLQFSIRWGVFFLLLAGMNEFIWRSFDTDFWVKFKVFGMLPMTILFMLSQVPFLKKHMDSPSKK
jgi:intracellular septation protein